MQDALNKASAHNRQQQQDETAARPTCPGLWRQAAVKLHLCQVGIIPNLPRCRQAGGRAGGRAGRQERGASDYSSSGECASAPRHTHEAQRFCPACLLPGLQNLAPPPPPPPTAPAAFQPTAFSLPAPPDSVLGGSVPPGCLLCTAFITTLHRCISALPLPPPPPPPLPLPPQAPPAALSAAAAPSAAPAAPLQGSAAPLPGCCNNCSAPGGTEASHRCSAAGGSRSRSKGRNPSASVPKAKRAGRMRGGRRQVAMISS